MRTAGDGLAACGFELLPRLLDREQRQHLIDELATLPRGAAGQRELLDQLWCQALAGWLRAQPRVREHLSPDLVAVQCTLFEKSPERNWLVTPHQDLAVPVAERVEHAALGGWSVKGGHPFVLVPAEVLTQMVALRLHLDDATEADGGLRLVPGSHLDGVLDDDAVREWRRRAGEQSVDALAGDALLMRPLVLHASSKGTGHGKRRVLHFLFGPRALPYGLSWRLSA